ncbi:MAG: Lyzozyme (1,4-beta-N-acetylmuramidase) [Candidatus Angelobacter sp.]|jgi:lysozyme|nr:Lyzozyme (1,4-beta-N-acetylmuramidase) [Candidatus Angelobacter sp.]
MCYYQEVVDWAVVASGGVGFAFAKASEGKSVSDAYFVDNWSAIKAAGMLRGSYHFFHPASPPQEQADLFLTQLAKANGGSAVLSPGDLPPMLDIEVTDGVPPDQVIAGASVAYHHQIFKFILRQANFSNMHSGALPAKSLPKEVMSSHE